MVTLAFKRRQLGGGPKAKWLKGLSSKMLVNERADALPAAESYILSFAKGKKIKPLWGQRPWHVTHGYDTATRETLPVFSSYRRVWCTSDNKQGNQMPL